MCLFEQCLGIRRILTEHGTLPVGPRQVSSEWFALARLGYSVTSFYFWSAPKADGTKVDVNVTLFSRVMEKSTEYLVACLHECFKRCPELGGFVYAVGYSDGGPNMKNGKLYGSVGYKFLKEQDWWSATFQTFAPHHGKCDQTDGHYSVLRKQFDNAKLKMALVDVCDVVAMHEAAFKSEARLAMGGPKQVMFEFCPTERKDISYGALHLQVPRRRAAAFLL